MLRKAGSAAQSLESHWSLAGMLKDNWAFIAIVTGLPAFAGWAAWAKQTALSAAWYDKALFVTFCAGGAAFLVLGAKAFLAWLRRTNREEGAIARGLSWSGHTYEKGAFIDGGSHSLTEIFGADQLRTDLQFRNCQIKGPGIVALFACELSKSEFFSLPGPQFIDPAHSGELARDAFQFVKCRFENCSFNGVIFIANIEITGPDVYRYRLMRTKS